MRYLLLPGLGMLIVGCAAQGITSSTPVDFMNAVAQDPATACFMVSTPYGGILSARAVANAKVDLSGGSCSIDTRAPAK